MYRHTILRLYRQPRLALPPGGGTVRYETPPGAELQHDWAERWLEIGGVRQKAWVAVNVPGYGFALDVVAMMRRNQTISSAHHPPIA